MLIPLVTLFCLLIGVNANAQQEGEIRIYYSGAADKPLPSIVFYLNTTPDTTHDPYSTKIRITGSQFDAVKELIKKIDLEPRPEQMYSSFVFDIEMGRDRLFYETRNIQTAKDLLAEIVVEFSQSNDLMLIRSTIGNMLYRLRQMFDPVVVTAKIENSGNLSSKKINLSVKLINLSAKAIKVAKDSYWGLGTDPIAEFFPQLEKEMSKGEFEPVIIPDNYLPSYHRTVLVNLNPTAYEQHTINIADYFGNKFPPGSYRVRVLYKMSKYNKATDLFSGWHKFEVPDSNSFKVIAFYTGKNDQAHIDFVKEAHEWFSKQAINYNFDYDSTNNWKNLNLAFLAHYKIVLFLDSRPEDSTQRSAFQQYMEIGGSWIGFHFSAFALTPSAFPQNWSWYHNQFLGSGEYLSNTWRPTSALLKIENGIHPVTKRIATRFNSAPNEWYRWQNDLRKNKEIKILLSIDPISFPLGTGPKPHEIWHEGYYPVAWTNTKYRMAYFNMGHNDMDYEGKTNKPLSSSFSSEPQNQLLINTILWLGKK